MDFFPKRRGKRGFFLWGTVLPLSQKKRGKHLFWIVACELKIKNIFRNSFLSQYSKVPSPPPKHDPAPFRNFPKLDPQPLPLSALWGWPHPCADSFIGDCVRDRRGGGTFAVTRISSKNSKIIHAAVIITDCNTNYKISKSRVVL